MSSMYVQCWVWSKSLESAELQTSCYCEISFPDFSRPFCQCSILVPSKTTIPYTIIPHSSSIISIDDLLANCWSHVTARSIAEFSHTLFFDTRRAGARDSGGALGDGPEGPQLGSTHGAPEASALPCYGLSNSPGSTFCPGAQHAIPGDRSAVKLWKIVESHGGNPDIQSVTSVHFSASLGWGSTRSKHKMWICWIFQQN